MIRTEGDGPLVFAIHYASTVLRRDRGTHACGAPPSLGEHTDSVLASAGFSPAEIAALHEEKTV